MIFIYILTAIIFGTLGAIAGWVCMGWILERFMKQ